MPCYFSVQVSLYIRVSFLDSKWHNMIRNAWSFCIRRESYLTPKCREGSSCVRYESYLTPNYSIWSYCVLCKSHCIPNYNAGRYCIPCNSYRTQTAGYNVTVFTVNRIVHYTTLHYNIRYKILCPLWGISYTKLQCMVLFYSRWIISYTRPECLKLQYYIVHQPTKLPIPE